MSDPDADIRALAAANRKIDAIKLYRERHGVGLKEAKDAVDAMAAGRPPGGGAAKPAAAPPAPAGRGELDADIAAELRQGRKIEAIRLYRDRYGVGLKEAKKAVEGHVGPPLARKTTPCFIATAAYGGPAAPEVALLRRYRDQLLARTPAGRAAIRAYNTLSPSLAALLRRSAPARALARRLLAPLVATCRRRLEAGARCAGQ